MRRLGIVLGLIAWSLPLAAPAQVNKWVDEKGRVQYGDRPPVQQSSGAAQPQKVPTPKQAKSTRPAKPLPVQPKNHVPGDPLVERLRQNEERKEFERLSAECWRNDGSDCNDPGALRYKREEEARAKAAAAKKTAAAPKPAQREPLSADFCKRNPRVEACLPKK